MTAAAPPTPRFPLRAVRAELRLLTARCGVDERVKTSVQHHMRARHVHIVCRSYHPVGGAKTDSLRLVQRGARCSASFGGWSTRRQRRAQYRAQRALHYTTYARVGNGAHETVARKIGSFSETTRRSALPRRSVETTVAAGRRDALKIAARARKCALGEQPREDLR